MDGSLRESTGIVSAFAVRYTFPVSPTNAQFLELFQSLITPSGHKWKTSYMHNTASNNKSRRNKNQHLLHRIDSRALILSISHQLCMSHQLSNALSASSIVTWNKNFTFYILQFYNLQKGKKEIKVQTVEGEIPESLFQNLILWELHPNVVRLYSWLWAQRPPLAGSRDHRGC